ncbi:hypothetical protein CK203_095719 [Vitis vinifera]|uniref:Ubiquitin-like protease family profile domain-containing protein n=1 Tax=Vitis vinifera TaxID=29760 RepID=A0A438F9Z3_VITVI|nr:hypothetical protein CK203_095719 [Vitis vinifera]
MGGICYERTLFGLQRALENRVSKYQDKKKTKGEAAVEAYSLVGFPYAFQVWAYEAIPLIGLKYATRVSERYPRILNWSATSAPRSTEVENVFLEPHLTFHSLLTPTLEEQQQDYYKHVDKQGASAEMLHQSNASQDAKNDDLRHEKSSSDTAAYVAAATAAMAEETTNDAITPSIEGIQRNFAMCLILLAKFSQCVSSCCLPKAISSSFQLQIIHGLKRWILDFLSFQMKLWMEFVKFRQSSELNFNHLKKEIEGLNLKMDELKQLLLEVKSSNEEHVMHDTNSENLVQKKMTIWALISRLEFFRMLDDEVERNDIPMDVNIDMEASRNLQLAEKHMTKELKDDYSIDDPVIDIAKLFGTPTMSGEFSVYVIPHHLSPAIFKRSQNAQARWIKHGKKWNQFKLLENDILIDYANGLQPLYSVKWPDVDIVYVPINVRASHWVLGVVHLHRRIIYVYDSLMGINNNARLQVAIKPLAKLLPHILNAIAYYGFHGDTKVNYQEWEIERLQDIPQQENE